MPRGRKHKQKKTGGLCSDCQVIEHAECCFSEKNFQALNQEDLAFSKGQFKSDPFVQQDQPLAKGMSRQDGKYSLAKGQFEPQDQALVDGKVNPGGLAALGNFKEFEFGVHELSTSDVDPVKFINALPVGSNALNTSAIYGYALPPPDQPQHAVGLNFTLPFDFAEAGEAAFLLEMFIEFFVTSKTPNSGIAGNVAFDIQLFDEGMNEVWGATSTPVAEAHALVKGVNEAGITDPGFQFKSFQARTVVNLRKARKPVKPGESLQVMVTRAPASGGTEFGGDIYLEGVDVIIPTVSMA
jgi:hypothetical protein